MLSLSSVTAFLTRKSACPALVLAAFCAAATPPDPEDSPLYASSRVQAFADMAQRDRGFSPPVFAQRTTTVEANSIILVEGRDWRVLRETFESKGARGAPPAGGRPQPRDLTTDISCTFPTMCTTCYPTTCGASCDTTPTCTGSVTCNDGPTCFAPSCVGPTCSQPTCWGVSCSQPGPTCAPYPSCAGGVTCAGQITCYGTCTPSGCPVSLFNVQIPQPGVITMSFIAYGPLRYTLQNCTNFSLGQWTAITTISNTAGTVTLTHTNPAPVSGYRLLVQSL